MPTLSWFFASTALLLCVHVGEVLAGEATAGVSDLWVV